MLRSAVLALAVTWLVASEASERTPAPSKLRVTHRAAVEGGIDAAPLVGLGYDARIPQVIAGRDVTITVGWKLPLPGLSLDDFRLDAGARLPIVSRGALRWTVDARVGLVRMRREAVHAHGVQLGLGTGIGGYWRVPGVRFDAAWDPNVGTHVEAQSGLRRFDPEVRSGWYSSLGMAFKVGGAVVLRLGPVDVEARGGLGATARTSLISARGWLVSYVPFYAGLEVGYRF